MNNEIELLKEAEEHVIETGRATISSLQRRFHLSYGKAKELMTALEIQGVVSEPSMNGSREVLGY